EPGIAEGLRELLNDRLYVAGTLPDTPLAAVVLCVSTPVEAATRRPNLEGLRAAARAVARDFRPDTLVVVRSTVPVGAGRSVVLPELLAERLSLDPMELIRAANLDYPRPALARPGFVGGGCLSKDPYILMASAAKVGHEPWLVGSARRLNEHLPGHVARRFLDLLGQVRGRLAGARVALLGFAYKGWPPTDDMRGAPVVPMLDVLR